jgi:hypothetical protein
MSETIESPIGGEVYFATSRALLQIARENCEQSKRQPIEAVVSLVFSAFYVEAVTNELLHRITTISSREEVEEIPTLRRLRNLAIASQLESSRAGSFRTKLQLISVGLRDELFDTGRQPYQDIELLMSLRDSIAHNRPETLTIGAKSPGDPSFPQEGLNALYRGLIARNVVPEPDSFVLTGLWSALTQREVAVWAINTAITLAETLAEAMPPGWRDRVFFAHDFTRVS